MATYFYLMSIETDDTERDTRRDAERAAEYLTETATAGIRSVGLSESGLEFWYTTIETEA